MLISYAQNFEDVMLWRALGYVTNGFYVDIGAQDPLIDSVSLAFYERGWRGIHVEPTVYYAARLRQQRPEDVVIQAAVGDQAGILPLFEIPDTGLTTLDAKIATQHRDRGLAVHETTTPIVALAILRTRKRPRVGPPLLIRERAMESSRSSVDRVNHFPG